MAIAPISGHVLTRQAKHFMDDKDQRVEYFDSLVYDPEAHDVILVRSGTREGLAGFEPGSAIKNALVEILGVTKINVTKVRPQGVSGGNVPENY